MMPHAGMGIRVRGCRFIPLDGGSGGGVGGIRRGTTMSAGIAGMLSAFGLNATRVPFYRKIFPGRRRG